MIHSCVRLTDCSAISIHIGLDLESTDQGKEHRERIRFRFVVLCLLYFNVIFYWLCKSVIVVWT